MFGVNCDFSATAVCPPRAVGGVLLLIVQPLNIDKAAAASGGGAAACASCSRKKQAQISGTQTI